MTSLAEAENKFGRVVRGAGGAIFGVERAPSFGGRQEEIDHVGVVAEHAQHGARVRRRDRIGSRFLVGAGVAGGLAQRLIQPGQQPFRTADALLFVQLEKAAIDIGRRSFSQ